MEPCVGGVTWLHPGRYRSQSPMTMALCFNCGEINYGAICPISLPTLLKIAAIPGLRSLVLSGRTLAQEQLLLLRVADQK